MKDAIEFARLSEVAKFTAKYTSSKFSNAFAMVPNNDEHSDIPNDILNSVSIENCNHVYARDGSVSGQPKTTPQQKLCFKCGLPGHIARFCYYDKSLLNEQIIEPHVKEPNTIPDNTSSVSNNRNKAKGILTVNGIVAGQEINDITIDTSSAASMISTVLWNKLNSNYPLKNITTIPLNT